MLAISTATKKALIALSAKGKTAYCQIEADCRQSEKMMVELDKMLRLNDLTLEDVGNFGLVIGPGSFTGLRIGAALIKGFCAGLPQKRVVVIPTLDLIAEEVMQEVHPKGDFSVYMNAQSGNYYAAKFDRIGRKIKDEHLETADQILEGKENKFCLAEEGFLPYGVNISCETLLNKALEYEKLNGTIPAKDISIKYIRRSQAEERM